MSLMRLLSFRAAHLLPVTASAPHPRRAFLTTLLASGLLAASSRPVRARSRLIFAVVPYLPARRLMSLYAPLTPLFEAVLGQPVEIASAPDYPQHLQRLRAGEYDIVADSLFIARIAQREHAHIPIARTRTPLEPLLVTPNNTRINSLGALKAMGKDTTIVVTDRSAALSVIGLRHLRDQGLAPGQDFRVMVSGSHANSLHRMLAGEATAAIVSRTTLKQVDASLAAQVSILDHLSLGLSAVVYHVAPHLASRAAELSRTLIDFAEKRPEGQALIATLGHEGLLPARDAEMKALDPLVAEFYRQIAAKD